MKPFEKYREEIDSIDTQLIDLLQKRMKIAEEIGRIKAEKGLEIKDPKREKVIIERLKERIDYAAYQERIITIFKSILESSRALQNSQKEQKMIETSQNKKDLQVGFTGLSGSYAEIALKKYFGKAFSASSTYPTFQAACNAILSGEIDYGVLPVENTTTGAIKEVYDLIREKGLYIVGETCVPIIHHLIGLEGADLSEIKEVYSHPQGLEQCSEYLNQFEEIKLIPLQNTAQSVKYVLDKNDKLAVAIASEEAAGLYGLSILAPAIQNSTSNTTRFAILSKKPEIIEHADSFSVVFTTKHEVGALQKILEKFSDEDINLFRIESRPVPERPWEYFIYVDADNNMNHSEIEIFIEKLRERCDYFRFLGFYRRGNSC